jgi:hypothetical protein
MKPKVMIGSSTENLDVARAIMVNLEHDCYSEIWNNGTFDLSQSNLQSLMDSLEKIDFAIFVLCPNDITQMRGKELIVPRDNLIFELGLFFGKLGTRSVYYVVPRSDNPIHLPTDLLGISSGSYDPSHPNLRASLEPFCNQVREKIKKEYIPLFPENGMIGFNILNERINQISSEARYSLCSTTPNNFTLKIIIKNQSTIIPSDIFKNVWVMPVMNNLGWMTDNYEMILHQQIFKLGSQSKGDLEIIFKGKGNAIIEYYRNEDTTPFYSKTLNWEL